MPNNLSVEYIPLASLTPYANNARTHSSEQVAQIADSIRAFGWTNPVLIDETGGIIAGHGRVMAAEQLGMIEVPCIRLFGISETKKRAYALADNRLALNAGWDDTLLAQELVGLSDAEYNVASLGFDEGELERLIGGGAQIKEYEGASELSEESFSSLDHKCPRCGFEFDEK